MNIPYATASWAVNKLPDIPENNLTQITNSLTTVYGYMDAFVDVRLILSGLAVLISGVSVASIIKFYRTVKGL